MRLSIGNKFTFSLNFLWKIHSLTDFCVLSKNESRLITSSGCLSVLPPAQLNFAPICRFSLNLVGSGPWCDNFQFHSFNHFKAVEGKKLWGGWIPAPFSLSQQWVGVTGLVCASVGAFRIAWTCMLSASWCCSSLCNYSERNPQWSVQRQADCLWIAAYTVASGLVAPKSRSLILWQCTMKAH
jgi:hypothetical protein